jgi:hypothetical protein
VLSALAGLVLLADQACAQEVRAKLGADCHALMASETANATDPRTGRGFFLDYPCDLKPGEKVLFILSLHGAGSSAAWQRRYFPAAGLKERYRLVIATPLAAGSGAMLPGAPPVRLWTPEADDQHLRDIVELVYDAFGPSNIRGFWLAGHSQGGRTANRLVCAPGFRGRVTGWLSLSGGRIGPVRIDPSLLPPPPPGAQASRLPQFAPRATIGAAAMPACDPSYIFETGRNEIQRLPDRSPLADRYGCRPRVRREEVTDDQPGLVFDSGQRGPVRPAWGGEARPGTAEVLVYPDCRDGRLVADVVRLDKGHTEGLEPKVTEALVRMMASAPGR